MAIASLPGGNLVDLTYAFEQSTIYWPTAAGFDLEVDFKGTADGGYHYEANSLCTAEHGGTHLDAPIHFSANKRHTDEIPLRQLIGPSVLLDVSRSVEKDRNYQVAVADFVDWEARNGQLPSGVIVLVRTGFGKYWPDRNQYLGTSQRGAEGVARLSFPGLHPDAARWLVNERDINAIGLDTASIDYGQSKDFLSHQILFAENIPAFENLANLKALPETGFSVLALPMKISGGSGGPLRIVALVPE